MKIFKTIMLILIVSLMLISPLVVNAETISKTVDITVENNGNHIFAIKWEQNDANLELISPDGLTINKDNIDQYGSYKKNSNELKIQYIINNAQAGDWKMKIIKDADVELGKVNIDVTELEGVLTVSEFKVIQNDDNNITFDWTVTNTEDEKIRVNIGYDYDDFGYNGKKILSGYYKTADKKDIDTSKITPDEYYFYIRVEDSKGIVAYKYSQMIEVINSKAPKQVEIQELTTHDNEVTIKWVPSAGEIKGYKIYYYIKDEQGYKLLEENEIDKDTTYYSSKLPFIDSDYKIGLTAYDYRGLESKMSVKKFNFEKSQSMKLGVEWPEKEIVNQKNIIIPLKIEKGTKVTAYHNNESVIDGIKEDGGVKFTFSEGTNNISFVVEDKAGNKRTEERGYYLDSIPPQLSLDKDYSEKVIKDPIITISGRVEKGCKLTINNNIVDYDKTNGRFEYDLKLTSNNKKLNVLAEDEAGNISQYECDINYDVMSIYIKYLPYILLGALALVILIVYYIKKRKGNRNEN